MYNIYEINNCFPKMFNLHTHTHTHTQITGYPYTFLFIIFHLFLLLHLLFLTVQKTIEGKEDILGIFGVP